VFNTIFSNLTLKNFAKFKVFDQRRALYSEVVKNVFDGLLIDIDQRISKIKLVALLITLMQGPIDVGFNLLTNDKITGIMLSMADVENGDNLQQSLAVELIVLSVSKYERATALIKHGLVCLFLFNFFLEFLEYSIKNFFYFLKEFARKRFFRTNTL